MQQDHAIAQAREVDAFAAHGVHDETQRRRGRGFFRGREFAIEGAQRHDPLWLGHRRVRANACGDDETDRVRGRPGDRGFQRRAEHAGDRGGRLPQRERAQRKLLHQRPVDFAVAHLLAQRVEVDLPHPRGVRRQRCLRMTGEVEIESQSCLLALPGEAELQRARAAQRSEIDFGGGLQEPVELTAGRRGVALGERRERAVQGPLERDLQAAHPERGARLGGRCPRCERGERAEQGGEEAGMSHGIRVVGARQCSAPAIGGMRGPPLVRVGRAANLATVARQPRTTRTDATRSKNDQRDTLPRSLVPRA